MTTESSTKARDPYVRVVGDTANTFAVKLRDSSGELLDLSAIATQTFKLVLISDGTTKVNDAACTITGSVVEYQQIAADVDTAGRYLGRFKLTDGAGLIRIVGPIEYELVDDI